MELEDRQLLALTTLASFNGTNGAYPTSLVRDGQGNLYGTTSDGGAANGGTVFEIAKGSNTLTTLASFNGTNGASPGSLILDSEGNLYGTTSNGGADGYGTVFEIPKGTNTITTLASFNGTNGYWPSSLVRDGQGNLYGRTWGGPANCGTVFEITQGSNTIITLASFNVTNGAFPNSLVRDGQGNLYGTTGNGGPANDGTVFELSPHQTITFGPLAGQWRGVDPIALGATADSGLPVGFSVISGPATVSGNVLTVTGTGTVVVEASQRGNGFYSAATPVDESFTVAPSRVPVSSDPYPVVGETVTFTVQLPRIGSQIKKVIFMDGNRTLGTGVITGSFATFSTSSLTGGVHTIKAKFVGAKGAKTSFSPTLQENVTPLPTYSFLTGEAVTHPSGYRLEVRVTAADPPGPTPKGVVVFSDNHGTRRTVTLHHGAATWVVRLKPGVHRTYSAFFRSSTSSFSSSASNQFSTNRDARTASRGG